MRIILPMLACISLAVVVLTVTQSLLAQETQKALALQDYQKAGQLDPLPANTASLYRTPWRSNVRTASAAEAIEGVGVYYKHLGADENVMKQMSQAGVKRLRLAPHHSMYIHKDWTGPSPEEAKNLDGEMKYSKAAGIRPCVAFIHIPPQGKGDEMSKWMKRDWNKGLMPLGEGKPGDEEYDAYMEKLWLGLKAILDSAKANGFTAEGSYDIEIGCNLWWGAPAMPPNPALTLEMLRKGGQVYEASKALIARARKEGYKEPTFWNGQSHHLFDQMTDDEMFPGAVGRAISFYHPMGGVTGKDFTGSDPWPQRKPLQFAEGTPPDGLTLCKPESYAADFSRHDNLIGLLKSGRKVSITSLGVVPSEIPGLMVETADANGKTVRVKAQGVDGWAIKSKGLTRTYAFWLNQGASFVLIHSAYEGANDEMSHALIPNFGKNPEAFKWQQSRPLATLKDFLSPLQSAKKLDKLTDLKFKYALAQDSELIAKSPKGGPLMASDAVAILPFQVSKKKFAVACYVVTPDISKAYKGTLMTLQVDKKIKGDAAIARPVEHKTAKATLIESKADATTLAFPVTDDVTWVVFEIE